MEYYEFGTGDSNYDETSPMNGIKRRLTYEQCIDIYTNWALGNRIVTALPNFALSVNRKISFGDYPKEIVDRFNETAENLNVRNELKQLCYNVRIFGASYLFVNTGDDYQQSLTGDIVRAAKTIRLIQATPLITSGSEIDINPLSLTYMQPVRVKINSQDIHISRAIFANNNEPIYNKYVDSTYGYTGRSVFENMIDIIKYWNRSTIALQRIASKAGGVIVKHRGGNIVTSFLVDSTNKFLNLIRNLSNDGVASINHGDEIELFNLNGTAEVSLILDKFNSIVQLALSDTPTAILLDERFAKGFGNGEEDFKALLIAVESYRETTLKPILKKLDKIVLARAFDDDFLAEMQQQYAQDLAQYTLEELRYELERNFSYEWESLYPESEANVQDNLGRKLDNLLRLRSLGANIADIQEIINSDDSIYQNEINLDSEPLNDDGNEPDTIGAPVGDQKQD